MAQETTLELAVGSKDEEVVSAIEQALAGVSPRRWQDTRDIITIITIVSSSVALITAILDLKDRFARRPEAPTIVVKNADRLELELSTATEDGLRVLIDSSEDDG